MKLRTIRIFIIFLFLISSTPSNVSAQDSIDYPLYEIKPGDSLGYIASMFNTTIDAITQVNSIENPDFISPGDVIRIPSYPGLQGKLTIVSTKLGETYSIISREYQLDKGLFQSLNSLLSPARIFPGTELIILSPDAYEPLLPSAIIENNQTSLEISARLATNSQELLIQNNYSSPSFLLPGDVLFSEASENFSKLDLFLPSLQATSLSPLPLVQGGTEVISIQSDKPVTLSGKLADNPLNFFISESNSYYALQGVYALQDPGLVDFTLTVIFADGSSQTRSQPVLVMPGIFDEDPPLAVDPATIDPTVTGPENDLVFSLVSNITPTKYWDSVFTSPAYYQEYNSLFGTRRKYNEDPKVYFHTGVDFAGGMTLPIVAPAPGKVVFAGPLTVRGNAIFIDHGWGVYSGFFHQDTLLVQVGDFVETGQQIGTVGNTGRVNGAGDYQGAGAHLHWELWVNGVQVNPLDWLIYQFP